jgi:hypothetical protein
VSKKNEDVRQRGRGQSRGAAVTILNGEGREEEERMGRRRSSTWGGTGGGDATHIPT